MTAALPALAAAALIGFFAGPVLAKGETCTLTVSDCSANWTGHAGAESYCTTPTFTVSDCNCEVEATCSVTADVIAPNGTRTSTTWTPSLDMTVSSHQVDDIDICFKKNSAGTAFTATLKTGCAFGETTAADAVADGLCLPGCRGEAIAPSGPTGY